MIFRVPQLHQCESILGKFKVSAGEGVKRRNNHSSVIRDYEVAVKCKCVIDHTDNTLGEDDEGQNSGGFPPGLFGSS